MEIWIEPDARHEDPHAARTGSEAEWDQLDAADCAGTAATCAARLGKGELILAEAPLGERGTTAGSRDVVAAAARRYGISVETADQYRRVAAWWTPERRSQLAASKVIASYSVLRTVALYTQNGAASSQERLAALLAACQEAAGEERREVKVPDYARHLGIDETLGGDGGDHDTLAPHIRRPQAGTPADERTLDGPGITAAAARAVAEDPDGPAKFFAALAEEGGLEALEGATSSLRKAKAEAKSREIKVFGKDEEPSPLEVVLQMVLRAVKAWEKPLGMDPARVAEALPAAQFQALTQLCGSVTAWHELLLAAARAGREKGTEAA
ncbi:hypothetical protein ABT218_07345 [Streptomyces sp. NPDC001455]|uniref:hypothetical protein n=1 Tax=Streptomyces sp. NPDC001455 TaxID=3154518 RepID=UPI0033235A81